jgi:radical SAM superfamily enzyme YgiQ (UPF0313 family)
MKGVKCLTKYSINALYSFILGIPTETKEELFETLDTIVEISKIHKQSSFTVGIYLPYPGSKLYDLAISKGFVPPQRAEDWHLIDRWENSVDLPWLDKKIALNIRLLCCMLSSQNKFVKFWGRFRLNKKMLRFDLDLKLYAIFSTIWDKIAKLKN